MHNFGLKSLFCNTRQHSQVLGVGMWIFWGEVIQPTTVFPHLSPFPRFPSVDSRTIRKASIVYTLNTLALTSVVSLIPGSPNPPLTMCLHPSSKMSLKKNVILSTCPVLHFFFYLSSEVGRQHYGRALDVDRGTDRQGRGRMIHFEKISKVDGGKKKKADEVK